MATPPFQVDVVISFDGVDPMDARKILNKVQQVGLPFTIRADSKWCVQDEEYCNEEGELSTEELKERENDFNDVQKCGIPGCCTPIVDHSAHSCNAMGCNFNGFPL